MASFWSIIVTIFSWTALIWSFRDNKKLLKGLLFGTVIAIWFLYASIIIPTLVILGMLLCVIVVIGLLIHREKTIEIVSRIHYGLLSFKKQYLDETHEPVPSQPK
eukprot:182398_1